VLGVNVF
jgi:hypothetical protein